MNIKKIAIAATTLIAAGCTHMPQGNAACSKKEMGTANAEQMQSGCSKKDMTPQMSCSKKDQGCSKK